MYGVFYTSHIDPNLKCLRIGFPSMKEAKEWAGAHASMCGGVAVNLDNMRFDGLISVHR